MGVLAHGVAVGAPDERPLRGIVLITIDTLRADHVGVYGGPVPTPALDRLAAEGVRVETAYTPTPSTGPAHASLFSGVHPWRHGVLDNAVALPSDLATIAKAARAQGFRTAAFVSSYMLHPRFGFDAGFDHYVFQPSESYHWRGSRHEGFWTPGAATTAAAMTWLTANVSDGDPPFFVWVHYFDPHSPYQPPAEFALPKSEAVDLEATRVPRGVRNRNELSRLIRAYRGEVRYVDAQVGRLVERLRILGLIDDTVIVVTADHGEGLGNHGVLEHGANLFDELTRVPLLIRAPGLPAGTTLDGPVQLEDLMPTVLEWLAAPTPEGIDGRNLLPWLRGEQQAPPRDAVVGCRKVMHRLPEIFFERRGSQKWIGPIEAGGRLYRLDQDPHEIRGEPSSEGPAWLKTAADGIERQTNPVNQFDDEVQRALEALGYAE